MPQAEDRKMATPNQTVTRPARAPAAPAGHRAATGGPADRAGDPADCRGRARAGPVLQAREPDQHWRGHHADRPDRAGGRRGPDPGRARHLHRLAGRLLLRSRRRGDGAGRLPVGGHWRGRPGRAAGRRAQRRPDHEGQAGAGHRHAGHLLGLPRAGAPDHGQRLRGERSQPPVQPHQHHHLCGAPDPDHRPARRAWPSSSS